MVLFPNRKIVAIIGLMLFLSILVHYVLVSVDASLAGQKLYSQWYYDWSPIFMLVALLLMFQLLQDPLIMVIIVGAGTLAWWLFVIGW